MQYWGNEDVVGGGEIERLRTGRSADRGLSDYGEAAALATADEHLLDVAAMLFDVHAYNDVLRALERVPFEAGSLRMLGAERLRVAAGLRVGRLGHLDLPTDVESRDWCLLSVPGHAHDRHPLHDEAKRTAVRARQDASVSVELFMSAVRFFRRSLRFQRQDLIQPYVDLRELKDLAAAVEARLTNLEPQVLQSPSAIHGCSTVEARLLYELGCLRRRLGDYSGAMSSLLEVKSLCPSNLSTRLALLDCFRYVGRSADERLRVISEARTVAQLKVFRVNGQLFGPWTELAWLRLAEAAMYEWSNPRYASQALDQDAGTSTRAADQHRPDAEVQLALDAMRIRCLERHRPASDLALQEATGHLLAEHGLVDVVEAVVADRHRGQSSSTPGMPERPSDADVTRLLAYADHLRLRGADETQSAVAIYRWLFDDHGVLPALNRILGSTCRAVLQARESGSYENYLEQAEDIVRERKSALLAGCYDGTIETMAVEVGRANLALSRTASAEFTFQEIVDAEVSLDAKATAHAGLIDCARQNHDLRLCDTRRRAASQQLGARGGAARIWTAYAWAELQLGSPLVALDILVALASSRTDGQSPSESALFDLGACIGLVRALRLLGKHVSAASVGRAMIDSGDRSVDVPEITGGPLFLAAGFSPLLKSSLYAELGWSQLDIEDRRSARVYFDQAAKLAPWNSTLRRGVIESFTIEGSTSADTRAAEREIEQLLTSLRGGRGNPTPRDALISATKAAHANGLFELRDGLLDTHSAVDVSEHELASSNGTRHEVAFIDLLLVAGRVQLAVERSSRLSRYVDDDRVALALVRVAVAAGRDLATDSVLHDRFEALASGSFAASFLAAAIDVDAGRLESAWSRISRRRQLVEAQRRSIGKELAQTIGSSHRGAEALESDYHNVLCAWICVARADRPYATLERRTGDLEEAARYLTKTDRVSVEQKHLELVLSCLRDNFTLARTVGQEALRRRPHSPQIHRDLAMVEVAAGDIAEARRQVALASMQYAEHDGGAQDARLEVLKGHLERLAGDQLKALGHYRGAAAMSPGDIGARRQLILHLLRQSDLGEALAEAERAVAANTGRGQAALLLTRCLVELADATGNEHYLERAISTLDRALDGPKWDDELRMRLLARQAVVYHRAGQPKEARRVALEARTVAAMVPAAAPSEAMAVSAATEKRDFDGALRSGRLLAGVSLAAGAATTAVSLLVAAQNGAGALDRQLLFQVAVLLSALLTIATLLPSVSAIKARDVAVELAPPASLQSNRVRVELDHSATALQLRSGRTDYRPSGGVDDNSPHYPET